MVRTAIAVVLLVTLLNGEIIINEVNYMTPAANDTNEFIELRNTGEMNIGMKDHRLLLIEICKGEYTRKI